MKEKVSWSAMLLLSLLLIVIGFEGSLGKVLACVLTPTDILVNG